MHPVAPVTVSHELYFADMRCSWGVDSRHLDFKSTRVTVGMTQMTCLCSFVVFSNKMYNNEYFIFNIFVGLGTGLGTETGI